MSSSILLEKGEEEQKQSLRVRGIPVCGANLSSPVVDQANYIDEIHYKIGDKVTSKMQINNNGWQQDIPGEIEEEDNDDDTNRDLELENIAGNLMIAEHQVDKLRQRLSQQIRGIGYRSFSNRKTSSHTFNYDGKCYKLSVKLEEVALENDNDNALTS